MIFNHPLKHRFPFVYRAFTLHRVDPWVNSPATVANLRRRPRHFKGGEGGFDLPPLSDYEGSTPLNFSTKGKVSHA